MSPTFPSVYEYVTETVSQISKTFVWSRRELEVMVHRYYNNYAMYWTGKITVSPCNSRITAYYIVSLSGGCPDPGRRVRRVPGLQPAAVCPAGCSSVRRVPQLSHPCPAGACPAGAPEAEDTMACYYMYAPFLSQKCA